jgi:hypothetical protein
MRNTSGSVTPLRERRVETGATLFDRGKMKARCVGDRLEVERRLQVGIGSGNCLKLPFRQAGNCLGKREVGIEIRVVVAAAVAGPPTGVHSQFHQVGEPLFLRGRAARLAAEQRAELIQIGRLLAMRNQIGVDESEVGHLILGIVVDVLVHVFIQFLKRIGIGLIPTA